MSIQSTTDRPGKKSEEQHNIHSTDGSDAVQRGKKAIEAHAVAMGKSKADTHDEEEKADAETWRNEG